MQYLKRRDDANRLLRSSLRIAVPVGAIRDRGVPRITTRNAPKSIDPAPAESAWIARYAWTGQDSGQPSDYPRCPAGAPEEAGAEFATGRWVPSFPAAMWIPVRW